MGIRVTKEIILTKGFPIKTVASYRLAENSENCQDVHTGIVKENQCCDNMKYNAI
jgi:hypothetical protein